MYLTQINLIRGLTKYEYMMLRLMYFLSKNLYNVTLCNIRQHYFAEKKYLHYESNYYLTKDNDNYKLLQAGVSQDKAFKSFFALITESIGVEYNNKIRLPRYQFKIQYVYEIEPQTLNLNQDNILAIDIGLNNLATCIMTVGTSFIMDGRGIKSIKRLPQGQFTATQIQRLTLRRNNRVNDSLISFGSLINQLKNLCDRYGMGYIEQGESYRSKVSFLDGDEIPTYNADNQVEYQFSVKRIKRGLYRTASGRLVNSDLNGAANILRI